MKKVFVASHPTEAHLVKGFLEAQGIPAEVFGDVLFGMRGEAPVTYETLPSVWVINERQTDQALDLISRGPEAEVAPISEHQTWQCSGCGETLEPHFMACWHCGCEKTGAP